MRTDDIETLTMRDVAGLLKVSTRTVAAMAARGQLRRRYMGNRRQPRFLKSDVKAFLERCALKPDEPVRV